MAPDRLPSRGGRPFVALLATLLTAGCTTPPTSIIPPPLPLPASAGGASPGVGGSAGANPGPALSGPTRRRAPSKPRIEPPPAATVWMLIIGARMRTPATCVSNARSNSPA